MNTLIVNNEPEVEFFVLHKDDAVLKGSKPLSFVGVNHQSFPFLSDYNQKFSPDMLLGLRDQYNVMALAALEFRCSEVHIDLLETSTRFRKKGFGGKLLNEMFNYCSKDEVFEDLRWENEQGLLKLVYEDYTMDGRFYLKKQVDNLMKKYSSNILCFSRPNYPI